MQTTDLIPAAVFCSAHQVEFSFIYSLQQSGLIEITTLEESAFIPAEQLPGLEKLIRLHDELDINTEGLEVITHLLQRINDMHTEISSLKNKLRIYETMGEK